VPQSTVGSAPSASFFLVIDTASFAVINFSFYFCQIFSKFAFQFKTRARVFLLSGLGRAITDNTNIVPKTLTR
jgi:hypothetical protein